MRTLLVVIATLITFQVAAQKQQADLQKTLVKGKVIYEQYCLVCHQADGKGVPRLNPPLVNTIYVTGDSVRLSKIVLKGLNEEIEINGEVYSNPMPGFETVLSDEEIADVLTYIRNNFSNKASAVSAETVRKVRTSR